jgi:aryl-alcohol dehydrogenase-like predicted oxidoreductase
VTFWDTANGYGGGSSEEFVGRAVKRCARREDIMLATRSRQDASCSMPPIWAETVQTRE